jgi:hypothetical protein
MRLTDLPKTCAARLSKNKCCYRLSVAGEGGFMDALEAAEEGAQGGVGALTGGAVNLAPAVTIRVAAHSLAE